MTTTITLKNTNTSILEEVKAFLSSKKIVFSLEKTEELDDIPTEIKAKIDKISKKVNKKGTQKMLENLGLDYDSYF